MTGPLAAIDHIVVLMLENRSFDHLLGFLYADSGNVSPSGQPFEGLRGTESNPDAGGKPVTVSRVAPTTPDADRLPGANPGEGYVATNQQLFGTASPPAAAPAHSNQGFVTDFAAALARDLKQHPNEVVPGTMAANIMACFTPPSLPVLSALARGFAVCDHWFASAPTMTLPNRAFACAGTSQGHMDDATHSFTVPSIFGALDKAATSWSIYGYDAPPLTRQNFPDTVAAADTHFGLFKDFQAAAAGGTLASYVFLEPHWSGAGENDQHPPSSLAAGEQLIHDVYYALRNGPAWNRTLLVITYDEHGGCYDHVPPPWTATPPDASPGEFGFDFRRFGVRVPTVLVSPLIPAGTVFRAPPGGPPHDHTSILKTVELRFGIPALTARDAAAPDVGAVLSLAAPRTDDPLQGVGVLAVRDGGAREHAPTHLQTVLAQSVSRLPVPGDPDDSRFGPPHFKSSARLDDYIRSRVRRWQAAKAKA